MKFQRVAASRVELARLLELGDRGRADRAALRHGGAHLRVLQKALEMRPARPPERNGAPIGVVGVAADLSFFRAVLLVARPAADLKPAPEALEAFHRDLHENRNHPGRFIRDPGAAGAP